MKIALSAITKTALDDRQQRPQAVNLQSHHKTVLELYGCREPPVRIVQLFQNKVLKAVTKV